MVKRTDSGFCIVNSSPRLQWYLCLSRSESANLIRVRDFEDPDSILWEENGKGTIK